MVVQRHVLFVAGAAGISEWRTKGKNIMLNVVGRVQHYRLSKQGERRLPLDLKRLNT
jgi:hypothetical protein